MNIKELKDKIETLPDDMEVVVFHGGIVISVNPEDAVIISDPLMYDVPVFEFGCGW